MSRDLVSTAWESALPKDEKSVLAIMANYSDDYGEGCWAGLAKMCYMTGHSRSSVQLALKSMQSQGIISKVGVHERYGTTRWKIHIDRIPMLPPFEEWKIKFAKQYKGKGGVTMTPSDEIDQGGITMLPGGDHGDAFGGVTAMPNPEVSTEDTTLDSELPAAEPAGAGEREPWDDDEDEDLPVNLRPSIDNQFSHGDEDYDVKDERLPKTPLETKLVSLIGQQGQAKYLGPTASKARAIRKQLNSLNHKGKFKEVPRDHPSAEDEWKRDPAGFSAYVETCAALIRNESKKNDSDEARVSMDALVSAVRNYGRYKTGWLYYQEALKHSRKVSHPDIDPDHWINRVKAINT